MLPYLQLKMSRDRIEAMVYLYDNLIQNTIAVPDTEHEKLLLELAIEFQNRLKILLNKDQQNFTIKMSGSEALGFYQTWQHNDIGSHKLGMVVVNDTLQKIDKEYKSPSRRFRYG